MNRCTVSAIIKFVCLAIFVQLAMPLWWNPLAHASSTTVKIQFHSPDTSTAEGYVPDIGEIFGERNGYSYGWNVDHASVSASVYETDSIRIQPGEEWNIALPNGSYDVKVSVGDAVYGTVNTLQVENVMFWDRVELPAGGQSTVQQKVQLKDGRLTLGSSGDASTSIRWIEIAKIVPAIRHIPAPRIGLPAVQNKISGNKVLMSGSHGNIHKAIPTTQVPGLEQAIGDYLDEQTSVMSERVQTMELQAESCASCSPAAIESAINASPNPFVVMKAGQLNLDNSVTFGSPSKPVFLIVDGINTNRSLSITVYGTLLIKGNLNANTNLTLQALAPNDPTLVGGGHLWASGTIHLNNDSSVRVEGDLIADSLIYNNGQLNVEAGRLIVPNDLHINTKVDMRIADEMIIGDIVSNNQTANIRVLKGDLFVLRNIHVNNHLDIQTGGIVAIGGGLTANERPIVTTGVGTGTGQTKMQYSIYGLKAEYYADPALSEPVMTVVDPQINVNNSAPFASSNLDDGDLSVRWTGQITPFYSEIYEFEADVRGGVKLWVNGELIVDQWTANGNGKYTGSIFLAAGIAYDIRMEYASRSGQPNAKLSWESKSGSKEVVPQSQLSPFATPIVAAVPTETDVTLVWTTAFNADGYEVEADGIVNPLGLQGEFIDEPLQPGVAHQYRVRAISGDIKGEWSPLIPIWTLPDVPGNIQLQSTSNSITLTWDEVVGATGYDIETFSTIVDMGNVTSYTQSGLNPNMQRTFRIRAHNSSGPGQWSTVLAKSTLPGKPGGVYAVATDTSVDVSWEAVSGATSYDLDVDGTIVSGNVSTHYLHDNLEPNTSHIYRVRTNNSEGTSDWTDAVTAITLPSVPQNLRANVGGDHIELAWDEVSGATAYDIEVDGAVVPNGTSTVYDHTGLESDTEHSYRVRAKNGSVIGAWSPAITRTTLSGVPVNLRTIAASNQITLSWDPVIGAVGYEVEIDGERILNNGLNTTYVHKGLIPYTEHTYRVRALSRAGAGLWSELLTESTALAAPSLDVKTISKSEIDVSWSTVSGATSYELMIDGELIDAGSDTRYMHSGLMPYSWHSYRVRAKSGSDAGPWSEAVTQATSVGTPVITRIEAKSTQITVEWEEVAGATAYEIEADGNVVDVGAGTLYVHSDLLPSTVHTYRVRAVNGLETGEWSGWSELATKATPPNTPNNLRAIASTHSIALQWDPVPGSTSYDLEVDGRTIGKITGTGYVHQDIEPNTMHLYRVRASNSGGVSEWSDRLAQRTTPELTVDVGQDTIFNFVIVVPKAKETSSRTITVTYDPDVLEVLDLSAATPERELTTGPIQGTNIVVADIANGTIVYTVSDATKTIVNIIRFVAKTNEDSKITYTIE